MDKNFSEQELNVLKLCYEGNKDSQIAKKLQIPELKVKTLIKIVTQKLGTSSRLQAVQEGLHRGILS